MTLPAPAPAVAAPGSSWRREKLPEVVAALARRPGHEAVRALLAEALSNGLGLPYADLRHEVL